MDDSATHIQTLVNATVFHKVSKTPDSHQFKNQKANQPRKSNAPLSIALNALLSLRGTECLPYRNPQKHNSTNVTIHQFHQYSIKSFVTKSFFSCPLCLCKYSTFLPRQPHHPRPVSQPFSQYINNHLLLQYSPRPSQNTSSCHQFDIFIFLGTRRSKKATSAFHITLIASIIQCNDLSPRSV